MEDIPFIHLFKTLENHYFYDVNTDMIVKINKDEYTYLIHNYDGKCVENESVERNIALLKSQGFLSSHTVKEIKHPVSDLLEYHLLRKIEMLTLQLTQNCNLRCKYCVYSGNYENRTHRAVNMSFDMAKRGIDYLIEHSVDNKEIGIGFYGGEPLLMFDLIKKCIYYIEQECEGKIITFSITTNGTLLSEEIVQFFKEHNVRLMISLDGPREIHNKNRGFENKGKGSFDDLIKNVKWIKEKHPLYYKNNVLFHTVIDPQNSFSCISEYFASSDMFDGSVMSAGFISDNNIKEEYDIPESFYVESNYEYFKILLYELGRLDEKYISKLLLQWFGQIQKNRGFKQMSSNYFLSDISHHGGPCIAGAHRLFLNAEGTFYPCERVSETSDVMKIGNINEGIDVEKANKLMNVGKISESRCKKCWAFMYCGICAAQADNNKELSDEVVKKRCDDEQFKTESLFKNYCTLRELGYDFESQTVSTNYIEMS